LTNQPDVDILIIKGGIMIIMKFGGTSVGTAESIGNVCRIVKSHIKRSPVVVVSAVNGMTDKLLECASTGKVDSREIESFHKQILKALGLDTSLLLPEFEGLAKAASGLDRESKEMIDEVLSFGERMSVKILAACMNKNGVAAKPVNAYDIGFVTDDNFGEAEILEETYSQVREKLQYTDFVPVVTGFIAKDRSGKITTLGRGSSDYTASITGAALDAEEIQIWTDVSGIKTADPKIIPNAATIDVMSFAEASELAYFGAKVLHPKTIIPAMKKNIPVRVLNTHKPENRGTEIVKTRADVVPERVRAVTRKKNVDVITITSTRMLNAFGFLEELFAVFARHRTAVDVVSTSEISVSVTVDGNAATEALTADLAEHASVKIDCNKAIVCVIGEGLKDSSSVVAGRIFTCLGERGINVDMISQNASEINISFIVSADAADEAVRFVHKDLFGS
jgi:aspartate kinase